MTNNIIKKLSMFTGIALSVFLLSFAVLAWDGPTTTPPTGNVPKPIGVGTAGSSQRIEGGFNVGGILVGDTGIITNISTQTQPTCNSSTKGMQWYDYTDNLFLGCNGTSWDYLSPPPWACGDSFTDSRDGNVYTTVEIGTQCWMAKNMNYNIEGSSWCYNNDSNNCAIAGRLYTHAVAESSVCPPGWKLPGDADYRALEVEYWETGLCDADRQHQTDHCLPAVATLESMGFFPTFNGGIRSGSTFNYWANSYFLVSLRDGLSWGRAVGNGQILRYPTYTWPSPVWDGSVRCIRDDS